MLRDALERLHKKNQRRIFTCIVYGGNLPCFDYWHFLELECAKISEIQFTMILGQSQLLQLAPWHHSLLPIWKACQTEGTYSGTGPSYV